MKKQEFKAQRLQVCFVCLIFLFCVSPLKADMVRNVQFSESDLQLATIKAEDGNEYTKPEMKEYLPYGREGQPALPVRFERLLIPSDQDVGSIEILETRESVITGTYKIMPLQPDKPITPLPGREEGFIGPDPSIYAEDHYYPENQVVKIRDEYFDRSNHIVTIAIYPLQYNPKTGELRFNHQISYRIHYSPSQRNTLSPVQYRSERNQKHYDRNLERLIDNPEDISRYQIRPVTKKSMGKVNAIQTVPAYEYVIVTTDSLVPYFETFMNWKSRKGLDIGIVTKEEIYNYYSSGDLVSGIDDNPGSIRQYLSDAQRNGTVWVLIGGNDAVVPARRGHTYNNYCPNDYYKPPTDLYYAEFNGDWEVDNDGKYGEPTDDDVHYDYELFIGRIPVSSGIEVINWTEKVMLYEMDPGKGDQDYLLESFSIQGADLGSETDPTNVVYHYPSSINHEIWLNSPTPHTATSVINEISNTQYGLWNFYAHGAPNSIRTGYAGEPDNRIYAHDTEDATSWGEDSQVAGDGINNISNKDYYPIAYSICCNVGCFDVFDNSCPGRTMGEALTVSYRHTGVAALLGNTRGGYTTSSPLLHLYFCDEIDDNNIFHLGEAEAMSKQNPLVTSHHLKLTHNLFGCPETEIWTDIPSEFANVTVTDYGNYITVNSGVSGSTICVSSGDKGSSYYLSCDNVQSYSFTTQVRPLYITVTKHNYIPYTAVTGGNFTSDETWFGNLHLLGTVTVSGNGSLTLLPNTHVLMDGYYTIATYDNACLIAEGTEEDPILFTSTSGTTPQSWNRLYLRTDNNSLKWCEIEYSDWGIHAIGYPSSGNVFENCTLHDNDQGVRIEQNTCDVVNCDIYNNRHNVVTINNPQVNISGTRITDGGRDGIYSASGNLLNLYGNVIENNGTGGTSTRNGLRTGYGDVVYVGKISYPNWQGYNTIRSNYQNEIYASSSLGGLQVYFSSVHDNSGYEIYNASVNNPSIQSMFSWWGEFPPNSNQFYGNVSIADELEFQPAWEGQTFSGQQFSKSGVLPVEVMSPQEQIALLKHIILDETDAGQADSALTALFNIIRTDFVTNKYHERDGFFQYLASIYNSEEMISIRGRALKYMILWKTLEGDISEAVRLSEIALEGFDPENRQEIMANLSMLYAYSAQFDKAEEMVARYEKQYGHDTSGIEFLVTAIADYKTMYLEEQKLYKDGMAPDSHPKDSQLPEEFALWPNYPNPFNPATTIRYSLPEASHVSLYIYNITGRMVEQIINQHTPAGYHTVTWDASSYSSGVYIARLKAGSFVKTQKMVLMK